jgi:FkbH-like protein
VKLTARRTLACLAFPVDAGYPVAVLSSDTTGLDYFQIVREHKRLDVAGKKPLRIAVLAEFATQKLCQVLRVLFARNGIDAQLYEAEYDTIELEAFDEGSKLYAFAPEVVLVLPSTNALRYKYWNEADGRAGFGEGVAARFDAVWRAIAGRSKALVVQGNFAMPYERQFGSFDWKVPTSFYSQVHRLNAKLSEHARESNVLLVDIEAVASHVGRAAWCDEKLWAIAKTLCSLEHLPRVAQAAVDVVLATRGRGVKCLVLDLDNTLWGGIIGDDGLDGIAIGPFGDGEPYYRLQLFLREMKRRGIVLCVASKNEHDTALRVFREHPEMVLREEDIAVFMVNWKPKVESIKAIQEVLNIGFDSMVFLDDNPFERNMVRQYLPDVVVPELPEDASDYVRAICELNLFETNAVTAEDGQRTALYKEEAKRKVLEQSFTNVDDYLRSLEMKIAIAPFDAFHLPRIAQLIQRSNQFNLTTRRYGQAECEALMHAPGKTFPLYVRLEDRFGDYGLICVVVVEMAGADARLPVWLMSCRVLSRGVEQHVMNHVAALAARNGAKRLVGEYIPSAKNMMVKDFYARFGFALVGEKPENGASQWAIDLSDYVPKKTLITETEAAG